MGRQYLLTGRTAGWWSPSSSTTTLITPSSSSSSSSRAASTTMKAFCRSLLIIALGMLFLWLFVPMDEMVVSLYGPNPISSYSSEIWQHCETDKGLEREEDLGRRNPSSSSSKKGLAVVIPLVSTQWIRVRDQVLSWRKYSPCKDSTPVDLYYYFDLPLEDPQVARTLRKLRRLLLNSPDRVLRCFNDIRFFSANLTQEETKNSYSLNIVRTHYKTEGTVAQFYNLMLEDNIVRQEGYTYLFYMEPDTRPIQPNWLSALLTDSSLDTSRYWIRGSIIRYGKPLLVSALPYRQLYLHHINGNAFYRFDDKCFRNYLRFVKSEYEGYAFDLAIHYHRYSARHYLLHQYLAHRWEYTDLIADLSFWPVPSNLPESTKLIHGLSLVERNINNEWEDEIAVHPMLIQQQTNDAKENDYDANNDIDYSGSVGTINSNDREILGNVGYPKKESEVILKGRKQIVDGGEEDD